MLFLTPGYLKVLYFKNLVQIILLSGYLLFSLSESGAGESTFFQCPTSPNCVSTEVKKNDEQHYVKPFNSIDGSEKIWAKIKEVVLSMPRTKIVEEKQYYFRAEATSLIFKFVDDLELSFCPKTKIISVKSASRVGYSDMGVNRKRVETLRTLLTSAGVLLSEQ